ncbi:HAD-like protein [Dothidotthia symphoricarpi CBS 119687]|uniref:HAD-like protein n=1 Tax=Dothidotthia symphoricarpi CBS 119687 TaxID=1392245 RepID=A0A6A6A310_9PLEO|nr:HAD-like protein [Dothidotthia symphoricarpi CBS 119687]KAF2126259.1 HAD-like protein [Dothidotthia symphoricarpi CBS 119687]
MSKLTDFKLLSFDVYGTLIDWERGMLAALEPMLEKSGSPNIDQKHILEVLHPIEAAEETKNPGLKYSEILTAVHPKLCEKLGLQKPTAEESKRFGDSVAEWPAFEDSVEALRRLSKVYKLVVLSNVDNSSFQKNRVHPKGLQGFEFDAIYTAEDIGSYKPNLKNFEYMLKKVEQDFGVKKNEVLQTAQSQYHDHHPSKQIGIKSCWIFRPKAVMGNRKDPCWNWKFDTLGDVADAVEKEIAEGKQ